MRRAYRDIALAFFSFYAIIIIMIRSDLIKAISAAVELDKRTCGEIVSAMLEEIYTVLENGGKYTQPGFGVFDTHLNKGKISRNPFTKQKMRYPEKRTVRFKPAKILKDTLNAE